MTLKVEKENTVTLQHKLQSSPEVTIQKIEIIKQRSNRRSLNNLKLYT